MQTGLVRRYGKKDTVQDYIDDVIAHLKLPKEVHDTALKMFNYIAQNTSFGGFTPTMLAMTIVNLAAKERNLHISNRRWSSICSYNTLLKHSRDLEKVLEKRDTDTTNRYVSREIDENIRVSDTVTFTVIKKVIIPPNFYNRDLEVNYFIPRFVKVLKGQEVEWVNLDTRSHHLKFYDVMRDEPKFLFDLGRIKTKESRKWRFDCSQPRIDYRCASHDNEFGTIVIYSTPEEKMTNKQQFEFLEKVFNIKPQRPLSNLVSG